MPISTMLDRDRLITKVLLRGITLPVVLSCRGSESDKLVSRIEQPSPVAKTFPLSPHGRGRCRHPSKEIDRARQLHHLMESGISFVIGRSRASDLAVAPTDTLIHSAGSTLAADREFALEIFQQEAPDLIVLNAATGRRGGSRIARWHRPVSIRNGLARHGSGHGAVRVLLRRVFGPPAGLSRMKQRESRPLGRVRTTSS